MTGAGRRTVAALDPGEVPHFSELTRILTRPGIDLGLRVLCMLLNLAGGRIGEALQVRDSQIRFNVHREGGRWMVVEAWPVEKKGKTTYRLVSAPMDHPFIPYIQHYISQDLDIDKPLFRQWSKRKWQDLLAKQLPEIGFFHKIRSIKFTNCLREGWSPYQVSKHFKVSERYIRRVYDKVSPSEFAFRIPRES